MEKMNNEEFSQEIKDIKEHKPFNYYYPLFSK